MVPGMVQDGSDTVQVHWHEERAYYLQGFTMVPGMVQDGSDTVHTWHYVGNANYWQCFLCAHICSHAEGFACTGGTE